MHEQRGFAGVEQQVFAAPVDAIDRAAAHARVEIPGNRPAQARVVHVDPRHAPADHVRRDTAPGRFDFREFGHPRVFATKAVRRLAWGAA
jgi:hypothetical protein